MESYTQTQWPAWAYNGVAEPMPGYSQMPDYPTYLADSMDAAYQSHQQHLVHHHQMSRTTESKPRLSKEEVEILEAEFQKNHKPNSNTKKALADSMRVENARINNWFQNRRAREKKENNIRKYEAKQKMEREKAGSDAGPHGSDSHRKELVASSAPFPNPRRAPRSQTQVSDTSSDVTSPMNGSNGSASPPTHVEQPTLKYEDAESEQYDNDQADNERLSEYMGMSDGLSDVHTSVQSPHGYLSADSKDSDYFFGQQYQQFLRQTGPRGLSPSHGHLVPDHQAYLSQQMQQQQLQYQEAGFQDQQLKSPPSMDIASRRNRRPPPLSINGARSFQSGIPKTGAEFTRRGDVGSSMRRVASATGTGRIAKPVGTPRSPFFEHKADALFHLNRSPNMTAARGTIAPPTPDTPIVTSSQQRVIAELAVRDPTLRTPPTTPGLMDSLFSLNSGYGVSASDDDGLATPSLGGFSSDFEMPSLPTAVPTYIATSNDASSQPETPLYPTHMGPAYFGYAGGNPEYNWSDASASGKSSPGEHPHSVHFMNMTPSNFHGE